jgi:hypothetical protein
MIKYPKASFTVWQGDDIIDKFEQVFKHDTKSNKKLFDVGNGIAKTLERYYGPKVKVVCGSISIKDEWSNIECL